MGKKIYNSPEGLEVGALVMSGKNAEISVGNSLPMSEIPIGVQFIILR